MTGQQVCFSTVILPKRCRTPGQRGLPWNIWLPQITSVFSWNMSLETKWPHMNKAPIDVKTIGTPLSWIILNQAPLMISGWTAP